MDVAGAISGLQQLQVAQQVSVAVAAKSQDVVKQQGAAAISLLEQAAELSRSIEPGKGARIDVLG